MPLSTASHLIGFILMAIAVILICGGGVYFGYYKSTHQRTTPHAEPPHGPGDTEQHE